MQAVIFAAGKGVRMLPLTLERPKALIAINGRPLLEHIIDVLPSEVDEIILVVGYKADMLKEHFGDSYKGRRIQYVLQEKPTGTAHALLLAKPLLKDEKFFIVYGDDLHGEEAIKKMLAYPLAILAARHENPSKFGVVEKKADGTLANIIEKPENPPTNLVSTGPLLLDKRIFDYEMVQHENGEYYLTYPVNLMAKEHPIMVLEQDFWLPIGFPEDIAKAEAALNLK